jgi:hypothetical protein
MYLEEPNRGWLGVVVAVAATAAVAMARRTLARKKGIKRRGWRRGRDQVEKWRQGRRSRGRGVPAAIVGLASGAVREVALASPREGSSPSPVCDDDGGYTRG